MRIVASVTSGSKWPFAAFAHLKNWIVALNVRFPPISVIVGLSKTFNNHLGFERGFWQRQLGCFEIVPKTAVFGTLC